jgi:hypothetical protein
MIGCYWTSIFVVRFLFLLTRLIIPKLCPDPCALLMSSCKGILEYHTKRFTFITSSFVFINSSLLFHVCTLSVSTSHFAKTRNIKGNKSVQSAMQQEKIHPNWISWAMRVAGMDRWGRYRKCKSENVKRRSHVEDTGEDWRAILKWFLKT